jgi:hypothetical protein
MSKGGPTGKRVAKAPGASAVGERSFQRRARAAQGRHSRKQAARVSSKRAARPSIELRVLLRRVPRMAWACALVAILNAACWSIIAPPFQAPDEPDHFAYVQQIAQTGTLPTSSEEPYETNVEFVSVLNELRYPLVRQQPRHRTISTALEQKSLERKLTALHAEQRTPGVGAAGSAATQPPLFYALEAVPFSLASNMLTRLSLMRLLCALMAGITALFAFLFVRESVPGAPWAWSVGGLAVAIAPLFGFISGSVNPDAMLFAVSAALFYCVARGFRRGLTEKLAVAIGAVLAIGLLTKLNFIGLVPGALVGVVLLAFRARAAGQRAWRLLALAGGIPAVPVVLYLVVNTLSNHSAGGLVSTSLGSGRLSLRALSYSWQLFLPRLPGMDNDFPGLFTTRQLWFNGYVGLFGWLDTTFPAWVYSAALLPLAAIAGLFARTLIRSARTLRSRLSEIFVYALMAAGLMAMVGYASYTLFPGEDATFAEARYLLPLLPLFAAGLVLAARGAGRRWGPVAGALIVILFLAHDVFSQLLVAARYYA